MPLLCDPFLLMGELRGLRRLRAEVVGEGHGRVLELGAGTGLNVRYYSGFERLVLSEPEPGMAKRLEQRLKRSAVTGEVVSAPAEQLPYDWFVRHRGRNDGVLHRVRPTRGAPRDATGARSRRSPAVHRARSWRCRFTTRALAEPLV